MTRRIEQDPSCEGASGAVLDRGSDAASCGIAGAVFVEDGGRWLRIGPGHAVGEWWLLEHAPRLFAQWRQAETGAVRDRIAEQISHLLDAPDPTVASAAEAWCAQGALPVGEPSCSLGPRPSTAAPSQPTFTPRTGPAHDDQPNPHGSRGTR